jgi:hypothetical protein
MAERRGGVRALNRFLAATRARGRLFRQSATPRTLARRGVTSLCVSRYCYNMDESGYDPEEERAWEVMAAASGYLRTETVSGAAGSTDNVAMGESP